MSGQVLSVLWLQVVKKGGHGAGALSDMLGTVFHRDTMQTTCVILNFLVAS